MLSKEQREEIREACNADLNSQTLSSKNPRLTFGQVRLKRRTQKCMALLETCDALQAENEKLRAALRLIEGHIDCAVETIDAYDVKHIGLRIPAETKYMSDDDALAANSGAAWIDDPPKGWTRKQLAQFARGSLRGEAMCAGNLSNLYRVQRWVREALGETE